MSISTTPGLRPAPTAHAGLIAWVEQIAALTKPARVHWCDGSEAEKEAIAADLWRAHGAEPEAADDLLGRIFSSFCIGK